MTGHPTTRMELLRVKAKKKLAQKGHGLLKKKRDSLIRTFFELIKDYKTLKADVQRSLDEAYEELRVAQAVSGVNRVKSLAFSTNETCNVSFTTRNLMGVQVAELSIDEKENGLNVSLLGLSQYVENARKNYVQLLPTLLKLAEIENTIFKLADEIVKTKRRVNALEYIKIPELVAVEKNIKAQLAEMERESFIRLKKTKERLVQSES